MTSFICFAFTGASHWMDVLVNSDVDSVDLTNDIDLADLASKALYLDRPISTASRWSMKQAVVSGSHFLQPVEANINNLPFTIGQLIGRNDSISNESIQVNYFHNNLIFKKCNFSLKITNLNILKIVNR